MAKNEKTGNAAPKTEEQKQQTPPETGGNKAPKTETKPQTPPTPKKEDVVELPKATLQAILDRLEGIESQNKDLVEKDKRRDQEVEMLKSISDKGRLARYESKDNQNLIRRAKVSFWEGSPVLAWDKVTDEVGFRDGRLQVNQVIRLFLDELDEETQKPRTVDLNYLYWAQNVDTQAGEVIEKSESNGNQYWTIQLEDGRKIKLDIRFINAF